jgi:hypothetical protein
MITGKPAEFDHAGRRRADAAADDQNDVQQFAHDQFRPKPEAAHRDSHISQQVGKTIEGGAELGHLPGQAGSEAIQYVA